MTRLILLDRDGVINYDSPDFIKDADEWVPIPGSLDAIAALKAAGYLVAVCSNQSGIGRGILSEAALERIHGCLRESLGQRGAALDGLYYCPHRREDGCDCRKPRPGMLSAAMADLVVAATDTVYVGDAERDVEAARAAGCRAVLVRSTGSNAHQHPGKMAAHEVADDLADFVHRLLRSGRC